MKWYCFGLIVAIFLSACSTKPQAQKILTQGSPEQKLQLSKQFLSTPAQLASAHGAGQLDMIATGIGVPGDEVSSLIVIPDGQCALFLGRGSSGIKDLDLLAFSDDGSLIGADEARDDVPTLLLCPDDKGRLFISARIVEGKGIISLGAQSVALGDAVKVAEALGAKGLKPEIGEPLEQWPSLDTQVAQHQRELGFKLEVVQKLALPVDSRLPTRISASVKPNSCLSALALPAKDIAYLDLELEDQQGHVLARAHKRQSSRWLLACAGSEAEVINFSLRPHLGRGLVALILSQSKRPANELTTLQEIAPTYLGYLPSVSTEPSQPSVDLKVGRLTLQTLKINGCSRIELHPRAPLLDYKVNFWSETGQLLARMQARFDGVSTVCAQGTVYMDAEARLKDGPLEYELTELLGKELADFELLRQHPFALGSLFDLQRIFSSTPDRLSLSKIALEELSLVKRIRKEISLEAGQCWREFAVISKLIDSPSIPMGLSLLALDAKTGELLSSDHHNRKATISVCAGKASKQVLLEFSLTEGIGTLLSYSMQSTPPSSPP